MRVRALTFRYAGALLVVAGLLVAGQSVIHQLLARQEGDARVINLAGRQRMLGQRLCTLVLALGVDTGEQARATRSELLRTADDWERTHAALRGGRPETGLYGGNSAAVAGLFAEVEADHRAMLTAARAAAVVPAGDGAGAGAAAHARAVRSHQDAFLVGMDRIVAEYEREARQRIAGLRRLELALLVLALVVLALDGLFVFRPTVAALRRRLGERDVVQRELLQIGDREQIRLAQDLHDGLGQHLIGVSFLLQPLRDELGAGASAARLAEVERLVGEAIGQTRDLVRSLHSRALETAGLVAALDEIAAHVERVFGVVCVVLDRAGVEPPFADSVHLHRIAREAVVNAAKHACATAIEIELARRDGELVLEVRDDGVGIADPPPDGMGLHLMAYRARMLGATLEVAGRRPRGTTVTCRVPLRSAAPEATP